MIGIGHASIGAVIGVAVATLMPGVPLVIKLILVFGLALFSHYIADWIPHGHYHIRGKLFSPRNLILLFLDVVAFEVLLLTLAYWQFGWGQSFWLVAVGMGVALLPDVFEVLVRMGWVPNIRPVRAHSYFHLRMMHWHSRPVGLIARLPRPIKTSDVYLVILALTAFYIIH